MLLLSQELVSWKNVRAHFERHDQILTESALPLPKFLPRSTIRTYKFLFHKYSLLKILVTYRRYEGCTLPLTLSPIFAIQHEVNFFTHSRTDRAHRAISHSCYVDKKKKKTTNRRGFWMLQSYPFPQPRLHSTLARRWFRNKSRDKAEITRVNEKLFFAQSELKRPVNHSDFESEN